MHYLFDEIKKCYIIKMRISLIIKQRDEEWLFEFFNGELTVMDAKCYNGDIMDTKYDKKRNLYCLISLLVIVSTILFIFLGEDFGLGIDFENTFLNPVLLPFSLSLWLFIIGVFLRKKFDNLILLFVVIFAAIHVVYIVIGIGFDKTFLDFLKEYLMFLTFGLISL